MTKHRPPLQCRFVTKSSAELDGYRPFSGYYGPASYWMLPAIERDMNLAKRKYVAVEGNSKGIEIWAK